jgi:ABC-type transporter Mla MlaB component
MLKIVVAESSQTKATLRLEGQVIGAWVGELERVAEPLLAQAVAIELDLASVSFVDRDGVELLVRLAERGARLLHCSPFVAEQLRAHHEQEAGRTPAPGPRSGHDTEGRG